MEKIAVKQQMKMLKVSKVDLVIVIGSKGFSEWFIDWRVINIRRRSQQGKKFETCRLFLCNIANPHTHRHMLKRKVFA